MTRKDGLLPGERLIPPGYDGVKDVQRLLELPTKSSVRAEPIATDEDVVNMVDRWLDPARVPRPYTRRLPANGTIFTTDARGYAQFPAGGDDILGDEVTHRTGAKKAPLQRHRKPGIVDRLIDVFLMLIDRIGTRI